MQNKKLQVDFFSSYERKSCGCFKRLYFPFCQNSFDMQILLPCQNSATIQDILFISYFKLLFLSWLTEKLRQEMLYNSGFTRPYIFVWNSCLLLHNLRHCWAKWAEPIWTESYRPYAGNHSLFCKAAAVLAALAF